MTLQEDLTLAYRGFLDRRRRSRRLVRGAAIAAAGALLLTGAGLGAAVLFGWPAPEHVKREIAAVDQGMPEDLRLNPDVENARAVASDETSTLYAASLRSGVGHCSELVTPGDRGRGATCSPETDPIDVTLPFDDQAVESQPVVLAGRLNAPTARSLEIAYVDRGRDSIPLGDDRYFVFEVPAEHRLSAHQSGFELVARDSAGEVVARSTVPADWDGPAVPDEASPLYVSTRSDASDFTKVYGVEGHVSAPGAASLELVYNDGARVAIAIHPDGSYEYTVPASRVGDFMVPQTLLARDRDGAIVASAKVAAVAYWRGRERGRG